MARNQLGVRSEELGIRGFILVIFIFLCVPAYGKELRVISLYPGHTENIFAMGGEKILIAVSENDDDDLLSELPRISLRAGAEKFLALKPDVVVTRSFAERLNPNLYEVLERAGVKIISLDPPKWNEFENYLETLGKALGLNYEAAIKKLREIKTSCLLPPNSCLLTVFIEATSKEIHTCAPDSWAANLIALAGGINTAKDAKPLRSGSSIAAWGVERVLKSLENKNLDVYIIQTGAMNRATLDDFYKREWSGALKGVKVREVPEKYLSRPSLLGLEKGLNELRKILWSDE